MIKSTLVNRTLVQRNDGNEPQVNGVKSPAHVSNIALTSPTIVSMASLGDGVSILNMYCPKYN